LEEAEPMRVDVLGVNTTFIHETWMTQDVCRGRAEIVLNQEGAAGARRRCRQTLGGRI
jgi:hypothetical protein